MKVSLLGTVILLLFATATLAQTPSRIALIDSSQLDRAGGIRRLVDAIALSLSSSPCHHGGCGRMKEAIENLEKEIADRRRSNLPIGESEVRLQYSKTEYERLMRLTEERYRRDEIAFVKPVIKDIGDLIKKFGRQRNYTIVVNRFSPIFDSPVLTISEDVPDVTAEFIKYCNAEFDRRLSK